MTPAEALAAIDKIEQMVDRIRNMDVGLKNALVAELDRLRGFSRGAVVFGDPVKLKPRSHRFSEDALDRLTENAQELGLGY